LQVFAMIRRAQTSHYQTASDGIALEIRRRLCSAGHWALRSIECEYSQGEVVLRGRVPTYYMKQVAQSVLLADPDVDTVVNLIEVADTPW
jgi:hypothetical protein